MKPIPRRLFNTPLSQTPVLPIQPYYNLSDSIKTIKTNYNDKDLTSEHFQDLVIKTGGRIIGRRKVSKELLFLDLQSNGETIQIMIDHAKL